jgi:AcrR family transcriptional regulator
MEFAAHRFAENGFHPTSVAEIVQGLGVGKGVFYWYFSSKDELFLEILREAQTSMRRRQEQAIAGIDDPVRRIEEGIRATTAWSAEHPELFTLFQFAVTEERFAPALRKGQQVAVRDVVRHIREAIDIGEIPEDADAELLAHAVLGVAGQLVRTFIHEQGRDPGEVAEAAVEFCLHGLLARSPAATR